METFAPRGNIHGPILPQFVLEKSMTFGAKTMYAILCDYAADKDHCWPSQTTLAKRLSCSISSVKNYLAELVREKLIFIRREQYRSSVYYLLRPEACSEKQDTNPVHQQSESGCDEATSGSLTTLNKQRKEENSPLSPHAPGETAPVPVRRTCKAPAAGGVSALPDFESVWMLYPKKEAKGFARMAWLKLSRSGQLPSLPELHAAIRRFAASEGWQREQGRFVPQMGNWLRGQRWLDPLPLAEQQAEVAQNESSLQALRVREEREQRLKEQKDAERARLRPLFDAFAAKFPPIANDAMPFGIWQYLHSQNRAPSADDVPPENSLGIIEFLNEFKRRRQTADFRTKRQPLNARRETGTPCRSVGEILRSLPVSRFFPGGEQPERAAFAYA